jgi:hypothetical protein
MSSRTLHLSEKWINFILNLPEKGMGYHLVNVILKNGQTLRKHKILNSSLLVLEENENINVDDIEKIQQDKE